MNFFSDLTDKNHSELLLWLKSIGLKPTEMEELTKTSIDFKKNETIVKQGSFASSVLLFNCGLLKSYLESNSGKSFSFKITLPFCFLGISSLFHSKCMFSSSALLPSSVFLIEKELFLSLTHSNKKFNDYILKQFGDTQKLLFHKLTCLSLKLAVGRIADTLLYLSDDVFKNDCIPHCISRKDIAELSGMSNENAVRILSDFKNDGIVANASDGLLIVNRKLLETISVTG